MDIVQKAVAAFHKKNDKIPPFKAGDTVEVSVRVKEGEKERIQMFKGVVLKLQGSGASRAFTVRKISDGIGVERTFPFSSPIVASVKVVAHGFVRRSRLFYLRALKGKAAKVRSELAVNASTKKKKASKEATATNA